MHASEPGPSADALARNAVDRLRDGDEAGALAAAEAALAIDAAIPQLWGLVGALRLGLDDLPGAIDALRQAAEREPGHVEHKIKLGECLWNHGQTREAIFVLEAAVGQAPDNWLAWAMLGAVLLRDGRAQAAQSAYERASALNPCIPELTNVLGAVAMDAGNRRAALGHFERALAADPDAYWARLNIGILHRDKGNLAEAEQVFRTGAEHQPDNADYHRNLGDALKASGRLEEAEAAFREAVRLRPDYAEAHWNLGLLLLQLGKMAEGWREYDWSLKTRTLRRALHKRKFAQPRWLGELPVAGKRILVHWEQGLGDTIHFCRYIPLLAERGADVLFAPHAELGRLMRGLPGPYRLVSPDDPDLRFDLHVPLMSLPLAFGTDLDSIPAEVPYLIPDPDRAAAWDRRISARGFRIGICWQGSKGRVDEGRSVPLNLFAGIGRLPGVLLISLHKGAGLKQLGRLSQTMKVEAFDDLDADGAFVDSAAIIAACDLVISTDTAIAHLAGALGVPTWLALKHLPDWRWMLDRPDSPWYPSMRLFRQQQDGDWEGVFAETEAALKALLPG